MILTLEFEGLWVFDSVDTAAMALEAVDVLDGAWTFCDEYGRRYLPFYTRMPHRSCWPLLIIGSVDIGAFRLDPTCDVDPARPFQLLAQAGHLERSWVKGIDSLDELRRALPPPPPPSPASS